MSFYNKPWAPGYSLPSYLNREDPLQKRAHTTPWLPRGTISKVPKGLKMGGYSQPAYVRAERLGSQAHTTPWIPDGTVSKVPENVQRSGNPWSDKTLMSNGLGSFDSNGLGSLGDPSVTNAPSASGDPIKQYGQKAAAVIMQDLKKVPKGQQKAQLRELLNEIDPKLHSSFRRESKKLKQNGVPEAAALQRGLASALSKGMANEFIRLGRTRRVEAKTQVGLASYFASHDTHGSYTSALGRAAETRGLSGYAGLGSVTSTLKDTLHKVGGFACDVATNPATPIVAGAVSVSQTGNPAIGVAGAGIAATACTKSPGGAFPPAQPSTPSWAIPAMIGGGALLLVMAIK